MSHSRDAAATLPLPAHPVLALPRHSLLAVAEIHGKGRGVVATGFIAADTLLEIAPVLPLTLDETLQATRTMLDHYLFVWDEAGDAAAERAPAAAPSDGIEACALVLGITALVNHSTTPNAWFHPHYATRTMHLESIRDIAPGDEITVDYDCELWFEVK